LALRCRNIIEIGIRPTQAKDFFRVPSTLSSTCAMERQ
jgi:hypothetical protein